MELVEYVEHLFGRKVDVLTPDGLRAIRVTGVARAITEHILYV